MSSLPEQADAVLRTEGLTHTFPGGCTALQDVTLTIPSGCLSVLAGANGCGKTVLMKHLNGLLKPTKGRVLYQEKDIQRHIKTVRQGVGLVFQNSDNQLFRPTLRQDIAFGPENLGWSRKQIDAAVKEALGAMNLENHAEDRPHILSGGWKKRAAIAGILAMDPEVICFDEPFTGLDLTGVRQILESLIHLKERGKTLLIITHDLEKILAHADHLFLMKEGTIPEDGRPQTLLPQVKNYNIRLPPVPLEAMTWLN